MGKIKRNFSDVEIRAFVESFRASKQSMNGFARSVGIPESSLRRWNSKYVLGKPVKLPKPGRSVVYSHIEKDVYDWVILERADGRVVTNTDIRKKALEAAALHPANRAFSASEGWIADFKARHKLGYRVPTHSARKAHFTAEDKEIEEQFFIQLEGCIRVCEIGRDRVFNFDQTMIRLVSPQPKTISAKGVKEVIVKHPPGEKEGLTIALTIGADGTKFPAIIVFKAGKTGVLSANIMSKLVPPPNVEIYSSTSTWWTEKLDHMWIKSVFPDNGVKKVLVRDRCPVHRLDSSEMLLTELNVDQIFIPPGRTGDLQPLDVSVNKAFKSYYRTEYQNWRAVHNDVTNHGYLRKPSRQDFILMISAAWDKVDCKIVEKSFVAAQIFEKGEHDECDLGFVSSGFDDGDIEISFFSDSMLEDGENIPAGIESDL